MNAGKAIDEVDRISVADSSLFLRAGPLRKTVITWRPKYTQFYSRARNIPGSGNYPSACGVLHAEDNEMSRNQNRIEQGDLK
jgi:hypothetical protein